MRHSILRQRSCNSVDVSHDMRRDPRYSRCTFQVCADTCIISAHRAHGSSQRSITTTLEASLNTMNMNASLVQSSKATRLKCKISTSKSAHVDRWVLRQETEVLGLSVLEEPPWLHGKKPEEPGQSHLAVFCSQFSMPATESNNGLLMHVFGNPSLPPTSSSMLSPALPSFLTPACKLICA